MPSLSADHQTLALSVTNLTAGYGGDPIVRDVSLETRWGEVAVIVGPNGAGKSTFMKAVVGLLPSCTGKVLVDGKDLSKLRADERIKSGIGYVPQVNDVFGALSVLENLDMGGYVVPKRERSTRIDTALSMFPVLGRRRHQRADTLSGGERKMLAIALVAMMQPRVLLLDEPTANLSASVGNRFLEEHVRSVARDDVSVVLVEQRAVEAIAVADTTYVMVSGSVVRSGPASTFGDRKELANLFLAGTASMPSAR
jgi:branched-chain amino acid transport system ATP-binding protein